MLELERLYFLQTRVEDLNSFILCALKFDFIEMSLHIVFGDSGVDKLFCLLVISVYGGFLIILDWSCLEIELKFVIFLHFCQCVKNEFIKLSSVIFVQVSY